MNSKDYHRKYYKENKEKIELKRKLWYTNNPEKNKEYARKHRILNKDEINRTARAKRVKEGDKIRQKEREYRSSSLHAFLSHKFSQLKKERHRNKKSEKYKLDISLDYLINLWHEQNGKCAISGKTMIYRKNSLFSASVDRIDPAIGYFAGNVQLVCQGINFAKNKYSDKAIRYFWFSNEENNDEGRPEAPH